MLVNWNQSRYTSRGKGESESKFLLLGSSISPLTYTHPELHKSIRIVENKFTQHPLCPRAYKVICDFKFDVKV